MLLIGSKQASALLAEFTSLALGQIGVFPVGNGIDSELPYFARQHTQLGIVNTSADATIRQQQDSLLQFLVVIVWVYPQFFEIGICVAHRFHLQECYLADKREIVIDVVGQLGQSFVGLLMHYDSQSYSLMEQCEIVKPLHRLIESLCSHDAIVLVGNVREYRHIYLQVVVLSHRQFHCKFLVGKLHTIG